MELINTTNIKTVKYLALSNIGKFRFITKCRAGFMTVSDASQADCQYYLNNPATIITSHKKGSLHTVEFCPDGGDTYLTVFAKIGTKIKIIDEAIITNLTVGDINQCWSNTNLYSQEQYLAVNAKTYADFAFIKK
jgi:hypothetical protein